MTETRNPASIRLKGPVEVHPHQGGSQASSVMLSPRVVDEQAFEDFAGRLRSLLDDASSASHHAEAILHELRTLGSTASVTRQKALIEAGAKLVKAVEASTAKLDRARADADTMLARVDDASSRAQAAADTIDDRLEAALEQRVADFERRLDERVGSITAEVEAKLRSHAEGVTAQFARITETREDLERVITDATENTLVALHRAHERAARLAGWDPEDIADGQGVGQPERDSLADLILRAEAMHTRAAQAIESMTALQQDATELVHTMGSGLDATRQDLLTLDTEREALEHRLQSAAFEADRLSERVRPMTELESRARETSDRLAQLLVQTRALREDESESEQRLRDAVDDALRALDALEPWRDVCFASAEQAERATLPPVLKAITNRFQEGLARDIHAMAQAFSAVAKRDLSQD
ncbi:MAG: hypothetical protein Tsb0013_14690 [Phycisphaerales bacterium]